MAGPSVLFQTGDHSSRPAAGAGCVLYNCTDHGLVYVSSGSSWSTLITLASGIADSTFNAKGDLLSASADDTPSIVTAGPDGSVVLYDSGETAGLRSLKHNLGASAPPDTDDDVDGGYEPGSIWVDTTNDEVYICVDATDGAAVWNQVGSGGGGTPATTVESETSFGISAAVGTDTEYARQDHTHGSPGLPKLDDLTAPDDNTDLDASASAHGLLPKLSGTDTEYLDGSGAFSTPAGGGSSLVTPDDPAQWTPLTESYEFDAAPTTSLPSGWSWVNQGSSTYQEQRGWGAITVPQDGENRLITRAFPSSWSTMQAKMSLVATTGSSQDCGLAMHDSGSGKLLLFGWNSNTGSLALARWTSVSSFSAVVVSGDQKLRGSTMYFRITRNSASSFDFHFSPNGAIWSPLQLAYDVSAWMTPTSIGVSGRSSNTGVVQVGCDWFRFEA